MQGSSSLASPAFHLWPALGFPPRAGWGRSDDRSRLFRSGHMSRRGLLAAVRDRMRTQALARDAEEATPPPPRRPPDPPPDAELEQLEAEARYHRDRFDLYHARVI